MNRHPYHDGKTLRFLNFLSLAAFLAILIDVVINGIITSTDRLINLNIHAIQNPALTGIMIFITSIANTVPLMLLSIGLLLLLIYRKKIYDSKLLLLSIGSGVVSELLVKLIIHRVRPAENLISFGWSLFGGSYSFPSGHTTMATIFFTVLLYSFKDSIKNKMLRILFIAANILLFLLIGFSRLYLNVHWFSDVIAGFALGLFWITFWILALNKGKK